MAISQEKLKEIEEWAYKGMALEQIALIVKEPLHELATSVEASDAFNTGSLKAVAEVTSSRNKLAAAGSGPAQSEFFKAQDIKQLKRSFHE